MKAVLDAKARKLEIKKHLLDGTQVIADEEATLRKIASKSQQIHKAREYYAASKIQAIVKGFLDRKFCARKKKYQRVILLIQRVFKGKLGRLRWKREYWRSLSVVKSDSALHEIMSRSSKLREHVVPGKKPYKWKEFFDPLTESFWYYNTATKHNTWQVPLEFQKDLVCSWEGFPEAGGEPHVQPCRCTFDTVDAYRNHMRQGHAWYCVACHQRNVGLVFPKCFLCGNVFNAEGIKGEKALKASIFKVRRQLEQFLAKDVTSKDTGLYNLKNRLISLAQERQVAMDAMAQYHHDLEYQEAHGGDKSGKKAIKQEMVQTNERYLNHALQSDTANNNLIRSVFSPPSPSRKQTTSTQIVQKEQAVGTANGLRTGDQTSMSMMTTGFDRYRANNPETDTESPSDNIEDELEKVRRENVGTIAAKVAAIKDAALGGLEGEKQRFLNPALKGVLTQPDFELFMKIHEDNLETNMMLNLYNSDSDDESSVTSMQSLTVSHPNKNNHNANATAGDSAVPRTMAKAKQKLTVCSKFLAGTCTLTTCPLAHPGVRDSTRPKQKTIRDPVSGEKVVTHYVYLCPEVTPLCNNCPNGNACRNYHVYIRPSTQEIILAIYPILTGRKIKDFGSARLVGNVFRGLFDGYGVMTYGDGSMYMGDWKLSKREGWGMYRSSDGTEYMGMYKEGVRHGWGVQTNSNGDEYVGKSFLLIFFALCDNIFYFTIDSMYLFGRPMESRQDGRCGCVNQPQRRCLRRIFFEWNV